MSELLRITDLEIRYPLSTFGGAGLHSSLKDLFVSQTARLFSPNKRTTKRHHQALKSLTLSAQAGDRIGILGQNGSGKTTLCRSIAGLLHPYSGKVQTNGKILALFEPGLYVNPDLTGRENAKLLTTLFFPWHESPQTLIDEALAFSELGTFIDAPVKTYSSGMMSRLCLSVLSGVSSDLLILDEVFGGTDLRFQKLISDRFEKSMTQSGCVILVSHALVQFRKFCNRLIVMHQGEMVFDGDVEKGIEIFTALNLTTPVQNEATQANAAFRESSCPPPA